MIAMCIICVAPPGAIFSARDLREAIEENKDGAGYMIRHRGQLIIDRSADDPERIVSWLVNNQREYRNDWVVFHARLATHGAVEDDNTHPFTVPGSRWALAHNGVCGLKDGPFSDRSDSRILAEDHIAGKAWGDLKENAKSVEKWLGRDKVVLLSAARERGGPCLIFNRSLGVDNDDGTWYSHRLFWPHRVTTTYNRNATTTGAGSSGSSTETERKPFILTNGKPRGVNGSGKEGSDWYGTYRVGSDGVWRYTARFVGGKLEPITTESGATVAAMLGTGSEPETDDAETIDPIDAMTETELIERAAIELGVTSDDLKLWGYDDPALMREILRLNPDDSEDYGTDPALVPEEPTEPVSPLLWDPLDPKLGWDANGYWDVTGRWHEPDGTVWEYLAAHDQMVNVGTGSFDPEQHNAQIALLAMESEGTNGF